LPVEDLAAWVREFVDGHPSGIREMEAMVQDLARRTAEAVGCPVRAVADLLIDPPVKGDQQTMRVAARGIPCMTASSNAPEQTPRESAMVDAVEVEPVAWVAIDHANGPTISRLARVADIWRDQGLAVEVFYAAPSSVLAENERLTRELQEAQDHINHADAYHNAALTNLARAKTAEAALASMTAERDCLLRQGAWMAQRLADLQLPKDQHARTCEWLVECGMPRFLSDLSAEKVDEALARTVQADRAGGTR
jgi:hypothetical protein